MMRSLRFIFIGIITFIFVTSAVFLRRTVSVLLCGVLSFNSASCYSFLNNYGKADAAAPLSSAVETSQDFSVVQKDEQKIADCFLGVCVNLPKSPIPIPGVTDGNPIDIAKTAVAKQIGEAVGVGSPLLLDQKTAYPDISDQVKDFHPQKLTITSAEDLQKPLLPGDYSLDVIAYCTQFSIHAPGRGLPYKLAPLMGKQAPAIGALLSRGTLQGIAPSTLNADSWRIQAGLPLKQWSSQDQALIHKLIPEYEKGLEGDYLQQIENTYNQFRLVPGIPSLNDLLRQSGAPGQTVLQLRQARQTLANQTISAERLPDMLYEPTGDGLPRVLPPSQDSSPSHWAEVKPGVFARFTVIEGNLGRNLFEFRVTPKASAAINNSPTVVVQNQDKSQEVSYAKATVAVVPIPVALILGGIGGYITYSIGSPAQALIPAIPSNGKSPVQGDIVIYRLNGKITHSGVIPKDGIGSDHKTVTKVISKWGSGALYKHDPLDAPQSYGSWTVYHTQRQGGNLLNKQWDKYVTDKKNIIPSFSGAYVWLSLFVTNDVPASDAFLDKLLSGRWWSSELPITPTGSPITPTKEEINKVSTLQQRVTTISGKSLRYDCHGYTFTNGDRWIGIDTNNGEEIELILKDNGYTIVPTLDTKGFPHPDLGINNINPAT